MSRKQVTRSLPPLDSLLPARPAFRPDENQVRRLIEILRKIARRVRRKEPHPFYSMREIAEWFRVPVPSVSLAYKQLEKEGFLLPLRGSMTLVQSGRMQPRAPVRGVVGLPVWLWGFLDLRDWRLFFIRFEEYLRRHHFAASFVFYNADDCDVHGLAERLLAHNFDVVIWFTPDRSHVEIRQILADKGVRFIAINGATYHFPNHQYMLSWDRALRTGLQAWRNEGITRVVVPRPSDRTPDEFRGLLPAMQNAGLRATFPHPGSRPLHRYLAQLAPSPDVGVIFDDDLWCRNLCNQAPESMVRLIQQHRVLTTRSINLPDAYLRHLRIDMAYIDWYNLGHRVVEDLVTGKVFALPRPVLFEAKWMPRVLASEVEGASKS